MATYTITLRVQTNETLEQVTAKAAALYEQTDVDNIQLIDVPECCALTHKPPKCSCACHQQAE